MIKTTKKHLSFLLFLLILVWKSSSLVQAQSDTIYTGNITVTTQAAVNVLNTTLSGKTRINGNLTIGYTSGDSRSNITDLSFLSNITYIMKNVRIVQNRQLGSLTGLNSLQTIGGTFSVYGNDQLTTLGNFPVLTSIGQGDTHVPSLNVYNFKLASIVVENNSSLSDCHVLTEFLSGGATSVSGQVFINNNAIGCNSQKDIKTRYNEDITVTTQEEVDTLRGTLADKTIIVGNLTVGSTGSSQSNITNLTPLSNIVHITGNVLIQQNGQLVNLNDLNNLQTIGGYFGVVKNDTLLTLGDFPDLQSIGEYFHVGNNNRLTSLGNFTALQSIGGFFRVESNDKLTTLRDFPALDSIGKYFYVYDNDQLTTLGGFPILTSIGIGRVGVPPSLSDSIIDNVSIVVENNDTLSDCYVLSEFLTDRTHAVSGEIHINNNDNGCNSETNILNTIYRGNITVTTQTQVNGLRTTLAGKTIINGNLLIESTSSHITDLSPLNNIVYITGYLWIQRNEQLDNLNDLNNLQSIGGFFYMRFNDKLPTLGNFPALQSIGEFFFVNNNDKLTTLGDFPALQSIGEYFGVIGHDILTDLGDFSALQSIGGFFRVESNDKLTTLRDFPALQSIGEYFSVHGNDKLTTLDFPTLTSIGSGSGRVPTFNDERDSVSIVVENNPGLSDCYTLTEFLPDGTYEVDGGIYINNNATDGVCTNQSKLERTIHRGNITVTTQTALNALSGETIIDGNLTIGYTDGLNRRSDITDLTPLNNITHITENLIIQQNGSLIDLSGFNNLRTIGGYFSVTHNDSLTFLGDFSALTSIGTNNDGKSIVVEGNSLLAYCCALTEFRSGGMHQVSGSVDISDNAMGCSSDSEVNCAPFVHLSEGNALMLSDDSSNVDFTLSSDRRWQLRQLDTASWVTLSVDSGGANDTLTHTSVRVEHLRNESYNARMVKFSIDLPDENETTPDTLTIIQEKNQTPKIELTPPHTDGTTIDIAYDNTDTITLNFTIDGSATGWEANINQTDDFIDHSPLEGTNEQTSITLTPSSSNETPVSRTATIRLSTTGHDERYPTASVSLTITQEAVPTIKVNSINGRTSIDSISIAYDATDSITIKFNVGGSAKGWKSKISYMPETANFVTLSVDSGRAQPGEVISIMAKPKANDTTIQRMATITLSTTGQIGKDSVLVLTITQEAIPVLQITSNDTAIIHDATDSIPIKFYVGGSAKGWESVNANLDFVTLSTTMNDNQTNTITIMAKPDENMDVEERTDTIILSTTGNGASVSDTFTITQKAAPRITLTSPNDTLIAHDDTLPKTIKFFVGGSATGWESEISYMPETDTFITLSTEMDTTQTDTVIITATPSANENTTPVSRKAIIKLITTGPGETPNSDSLTITQESRPTIMLTSHSDGETITIAHDAPKSITLNFLIGGSATDLMSTISYIPKGANFISTLIPTTNDNNDTISIKVSPNSDNLSNTDTESRTATITLITAEHLGTPDSVSLTITQEGKPALDLFSNRNDTIAYDANTTDSIPITFFVGGSATGWESVNTNPEFITLSPKDSMAQTDTITIMASPMENMGNERIAVITLRTTGQIGDSVITMFTITQEAVPNIELIPNDTDIIAYDATNSIPITFNVGGSSATGWKSDITYEGTNSTFITLSPDSGMAQTNITITATPSANEDTILRKATIKLSTTGQKGTPKSVSLTITQEAIPVLQITSNDTAIIHDETDSIPIKFYVGGSAKGWTSMNTNFNFVKLGTTMNDNQTDTVTIMAKPDENMDVEERTDTIILSTTGKGASVSDTFTITQKAAPRITLTSPSNISIPHHDIMPRTIKFFVGGSATGWESEISYMPETDTFITLSTEMDTTQTDTVIITATPSANENTTPVSRKAIIKLITTGPGETPNSDSLTITQESRPTIMLTSHTNADSLLKPDGDIIDIAHNHTNSIIVNFMLGGSATGWKSKITGDPFISLASDSGSNNNITIFIKNENTTTTPRTATITLRTTGQIGDSVSVSLTIIQEGKPALDIISNRNDTIAYDATDSIPITFFVGGSATGWESVNTNPDFITLFPKDSIAQTDTITIMASPMENMGNERIATITLRTTGQIGTADSVSLTITQEAVPNIELIPNDTDIIAYDATNSIPITFNVGGSSATGWKSDITYEGTNSTFITLSLDSGMAQTNITITATPSANEDTILRKATITLSTTGQRGDSVSVSLTITQEAKPVLQITSNDTAIIHDATDSIPIKFYVGGSATGWTSVNTNFNFVKLGTTMNDNQTDTVTIMAKPDENMNVEERTDTIILSTTGHIDEEAFVSDTFTIIQKAAPGITLTSPGDTSISIPHHDIMPRTISFALGGSATGWESSIIDTASFITLDTLNDGTRAIEITPKVNTTTEERTATITLRTTGSGGTPDSVSLTITQEAMPTIMLSSYNGGDSLLNPDGDTIDIAYDHIINIRIPIKLIFGGSATGWKSTITYPPDTPEYDKFIASTLKEEDDDNNIDIPIKNKNTNTASRTATITLSTTGQIGDSVSVSLTIRQEGVPTLTLTSNDTVTLDHDATTAENITFSLGGSAIGWSAMSSDTSFIKVLPMGTEGVIGVSVVGRPNTTDDRTSTITITTRGRGSSVSETVMITQEAVPTVTLVSSNDISIAHDNTDTITIDFTVGGSSVTGWNSKISYMPETDTFITLFPENSNHKGVIKIKAIPMKNTEVKRTAMITLSTTGSGGTPKSASFIITQEAIPVLEITSKDTTIIHDATDPIPIKFYVGGSATGWTSVNTNFNFVTLGTTMNDNQTDTVTIMAIPKKNSGIEDRTDTIILSTTGQIGDPVSDIFTITQKAAPRITLTSRSDGGNIDVAHDDTIPRTISFALGGSATGWESSIIDTASFITLGTLNDGTRAIEITPKVNTTTEKRTATITLRTMGEGTPDRVSLTITQESRPTIMLSSYNDGDIIDIAHNHTNSITIDFLIGGSATGWKREITANDFIENFDNTGNVQTGVNIQATIPSPSANTDTESRTATITLSTTGQIGDSVSVSLTIRQEGKPVLDFFSNHNDTIAYDATDSIPIKFFVGGSAKGWESEITGNPFITLSPEKDTAQTDTITIMASPMENMGVERTATITLRTTGQIGDSVITMFTITQEAVPTIEVNSINSHADSTESISIAHDATDSIPIEFDVEGSAKGWESKITYTGNSGFITLSTKKDTAEIGVIKIKANPMKNMGDERIAAITLSTTGQIGTPKSVSLTITQEAIPILQITDNDSVNIIHDETDSIPIKFYVGGSATGWTSMNSNFNFVKLGTTMNDNQTDTVTIMAKPMKNMGNDRTDTIILSTTGNGDPVSDTFTIIQKAAPRITLTSPGDTSISIPHDEIMPITISFTLKGNFTGWESSIIDTASFITLDTLNDGTRAIEITPKVNTTTEERTATITLRTTGSGGTPDSVSLTITQEAMPTIMLTSHTNGETITIAHDAPKSITLNFLIGGSATDLMSTISYIPKGANFISTLIPTTNDNNDTISIKVSPNSDNLSNTDTESRTATITLITAKHLGTPDSVSLTIRQEGKPVLDLFSNRNDTIAYDANITDSTPITFYVGGSATGWESENTNPDFITLFPKDSIAQTDTITFMAIPMENPDIRERTTTITLRTTGQIGTSKSVSLTITQKAAPTIKLISIDSISIAYDNTDPIPINFFVGGSATGWESEITYANTDSTFITLDTKMNAGQISDITITATTPSANEDTIPRTATITLSTTGQEGDSVSVSLIITQEAKPVLKLTSNDNDTIAHDAIDSIPIHFNVGGSATGWNSEITYTPSDANFVTLSSEESMDQTGPITIMASPSANTDLKKRTATIILSTEGNGASVKDTLTITQAAAPEIKMTTSHTNGENIKIAHNDTEPIPLNFTLKGSAEGWRTDTIIYTPENADFITSPQTTDEADDTIFTQITPKVNTTTEERTATIRLKTTGHEGTPDSVSLTITQEAMPVIELISKKTDTIIHDATDSIPINFTVGGSAKGWISVNSNSDFITLSPKDSITQTGNITIMASPTENTDNEDRIATITLSTTGQIGTPASAVFTIIQKAKPTIILTSHTDGDTTSIAYNDNIRKSIEFTVSGSAKGWASHIDYMPDSANFITLNPPNDDITGNITIRLIPSANASVERSATIILITAGHEGTPDSVSFTITQDAGAEPPLGVAPSKPFTLYPNPTNGTLTIEGVTGYLQMYIYDLVGREVMTYSLTPSKKTIDVSDLPSGMYVITLRGKGKTWKEILMKK